MTRPLVSLCFVCIPVWLALQTAAAAQAPSVAVTTAPAKRGSLPRLVEAFGTFGPLAGGVRTLSLDESGQIGRVLVTPGQAVKRNDPLLEWAQSNASRQAWEQARTAFSLAQQQRAHTALLLDRHLATRDQLDQVDKALSDAQAALDALRRLGADQTKRLIRTPVDGVVTSLPVLQGNFVGAGAVLAVVAEQAGLGLVAGVEPADARRLQAGQTAAVSLLSGGAAMTAAVRHVGGQLEPQTRLVPVELAVSGAFLSGETARADIDAGPVAGWLVPDKAVLQDGDGSYLFQVAGDGKAGGKAARVAVVVEERSGDTDLVTGPLDAARPVVVDGAFQLSDGAAVREAAP